MANSVRIGVIGTSRYAAFMHLANLKRHPQAELSALCGRSRTHTEDVAAAHAIPQVFTDYHEMIAHGDLHAVVIAAPDDLHYPMTMAAVDAGLHVLCEKPLALKATQARAMYERAEAVGVKHMTFFTYRWLPIYRYARQRLDEGYIGRCLQCDIRYLAGYGRAGNYLWRFDRARANGALGDMGSHMIDLARWFVGDITEVHAQLSTFVNRPGPNGEPLDAANDAAFVGLRFASGAAGMIQVSAVAHVGERGQEHHVVLHGDDGTLEIDLSVPGGTFVREIRGVHGDETSFRVLTVPDELWGEAARDSWWDVYRTESVGDRAFVDAILDNSPIAPTFYDGYRAQAVIDAAMASKASGAWVTVE